ncbi:MAG TPA: hypothetical protein VG675_01530 [Bryobacteraceae bacterium]|nr:hypothetical protein [Bryobacteraceae bacterium]
MRTHALLFLIPVLAVAEVSNVSVIGVTSSQAVISYTAPDTNTCTLEVSESATFTPLVYDVDPTLFPGSSSDSRPGNVSIGRARIFVVGTHRADITATNKLRYSRALQADTAHYFRITCGADRTTGSFMTANIPLGKTYGELPPVDPSRPGDYAWPTWDWKTPGYRMTDPWTGALYQQFSRPQSSKYQFGGVAFGSAMDTGTSNEWSNAGQAIVDNGPPATYSGSKQSWLLLRTPANFTFYPSSAWKSDGNSFDYFQPSFKAWGSASSDADRSIDVCLTVNGVTCTSLTQTIVVGTSEPGSATTIGTQDVYNRYWTDATHTFAVGDSSARAGTVNVDSSGNVTWVSGDKFSLYWTPGSHITIAGSDCAVTALTTSSTLAVNPGSCTPALVVPAPGAAYTASNFGLLIRKSTNTADTISVKGATYAYGSSNDTQEWASGGGAGMCGIGLVADNGTPPQYGYHCSVLGMFYWINPATGEVRFLGDIRWPPHTVGSDTISGACTSNSAMFSASDANVFYCGASTASGDAVILQGTYTGNNQDVGSGPAPSWVSVMPITWTNLTPTASGSLSVLAHNFNNAFDPSLFKCSLSGATDGGLIYFNCAAGGQNSIAWSGIFDPTQKAVTALRSSWSLSPTRWCGVHSYAAFGNYFTYAFAANTDSTSAGMGLYTVKLPNNELSTASVEDCPTNNFGVTGPHCITVAPLSEPCDFSPATSEAQNCTDYGGNSQPAYHLQDAQEGDVFTASGPNELLRLIVKNGSTWVLQRGYGSTSPSAHTASSMYATCEASNFRSPEQQTLWNFAADPNGTDSNGTTVLPMQHGVSHSSGLASMLTGGADYWDCRAGIGPNCLAVYEGDPSNWATEAPTMTPNSGPAFSGQTGYAYGNLVETYTSPGPSSTTGPDWFVLQRPWETDGAMITANAVGTQLYKMTAAGETRPLHRKQVPTLAICGDHPLLDVSGPNSTLDDSPADQYKYCVANAPGECSDSGHSRSTSTGDIYVNCPLMSAGPSSCGTASEDDRGICIGDKGAYTQGIEQVFDTFDAPNGAATRKLTSGFRRYRLGVYYWSARVLPDGSWMIVRPSYFDRQRSEEFLVKIPPLPSRDSIDRSNFIPMTLSLTPPASVNVNNAVVQFGYAENGDPSDFYCTSRRETCMAASGTINQTAPFSFSSENPGGMPCASGCQIQIPAIPQRVLYYRVQYRDASNNVVAQSEIQVAAVP